MSTINDVLTIFTETEIEDMTRQVRMCNTMRDVYRTEKLKQLQSMISQRKTECLKERKEYLSKTQPLYKMFNNYHTFSHSHSHSQINRGFVLKNRKICGP